MRRTLARQLAVIMFTDMVGFTALAQRSETQALRLLREQRVLVRRLLPRFGGREVKTIGDGFLIRFTSALHATQCAVAIQQQIQARKPSAGDGELCLRIGLHLGDIERPRHDVLGDSVNLAARIQSVAPAGGVAMSGVVYEHIRNQLPAPFEFQGRVVLKNVQRPVALFALGPQQLAGLPPITPPLAPPRYGAALATVVLVASLAVAGGLWTPTAPRHSDAAQAIAVLPLANLGSGPGSAEFADGMHDALLTRLAGVGGLKVISRTSVLEYRGATRRLSEIAAELGAAHIVEGSVQRLEGRVRVTARLVEANSDRQLWARSYDRALDDVFAIQGEIASGIAQEVRAVLTPAERRRLGEVPTRDTTAYELYLRAIAMEHEDRFSATNLARMQALLEDAIKRDPGFALAHAALARGHVYAFDAGHDGTAGRLAQAESAAQRALRLAPDLPEAHLALGLYHYYGFLRFDRALAEFDQALAGRPGDADLWSYRGFVLRRLGRFPEALDSLQQARARDPRNPLLIYELAATHAFLRQNADAERVCRSLPRNVPQAGDFRAQCLVFSIRRRGDLEPAHALERDLASIANAGPDRHWVQYELAVNEGRFADAQSRLASLSDEELESWAGAPPREMLLADLARWRGDATTAAKLYARAEAQVRERLESIRDNGALLANRAFAHALHGRLLARLGRRAEAVVAAEQALDLLPSGRDRFYGPSLVEDVARIDLALGDVAGALDRLEPLLATHSHTHIHDLRLQRAWAELWEHPRFLQLVRRYAPEISRCDGLECVSD